jgi:hypothetical protein
VISVELLRPMLRELLEIANPQTDGRGDEISE